MRTVASPIRLATGSIRRSTSSPSPRSTTSDRAASSSPSLSVGKWLLSAAMSLACCFTSGSFGGDGWATHDILLALATVALGRAFDLGGGDLAGDELGVVLDPTDQGRSARVLPR